MDAHALEASSELVAVSDQIRQLAGDIAMHITALKPLALDRDCLDQAAVEQEKAVAAEQVKNKPENIIEKIIEGKMRKFFAENCLVDQMFVKDDSKSVGQMVCETAKKCGGEAKIKKIIRFEIG